MPKIPDLTFHDGHSIPQFGLGVFQLDDGDTARVVSAALNKGYRLIDTAALYGNEVGVGDGLKQADVDRDEVFVTSKVWNDMQGYDNARKSLRDSLDRLKLDRLDLFLIHWPCPDQNLYVETWKALIDAQKDGEVTSIGVSNFNPDHLERIIGETGVTPVLNQVELNPKLQQAKVREADAAHNIVTQCWTPLGRGRSMDAPEITKIAERTGKSPAQVILRWHVELGSAVIAKTDKEDRLAENMDIFDFELTEEDMAAIATLHTGERTGPNPAEFNG